MLDQYLHVVQEALAELRIPANRFDVSIVVFPDWDPITQETIRTQAIRVSFMVGSYPASHLFFFGTPYKREFDVFDHEYEFKSCLETLGDDIVLRLAPYFPNIARLISCPVEECQTASHGPYRTPLYDAIMHLNDKHEWTREAIAEWLEVQPVDISFTEPKGLPGLPLALAGTNPYR